VTLNSSLPLRDSGAVYKCTDYYYYYYYYRTIPAPHCGYYQRAGILPQRVTFVWVCHSYVRPLKWSDLLDVKS